MKKMLLLSVLILTTIAVQAQLPSMVQDIVPGYRNAGPYGMLTWRGAMYFIAYDSLHGYELWRYDERSPAKLALDFNPGKGNGIAAICVYQDKLILSGDNGSGYEVYSYDGLNTPVKLTSIWPHANSGPPHGFTVAGGKLYFSAGHYRLMAGFPSLVTDLFSYNGIDTPKFYAPAVSSRFGLMPDQLIAYNNKLYFAGAYVTMGPIRLIHEVDPVTDSMRTIQDLPGTTDKAYHFYDPIVYGSRLYFSAYHIKHLTTTSADTTTEWAELHSWDGNTIRQLTNLGPEAYPGISQGLGGYDGSVYFGGLDADSTFQLYAYDTLSPQIRLACIINPKMKNLGNILSVIAYNSGLYFVAYAQAAGYELWHYIDGSCGILMDIFPGSNSGITGNGGNFHIYNGHLYFCANDSVHGQELWRIEGTTGLKNITWSGGVSIYPNPTQASVTLDITLPDAQSLQVTVSDASGKQLYSRPVQKMPAGKSTVMIPMQIWASGVYFYQVRDTDGSKLASGRIVRD